MGVGVAATPHAQSCATVAGSTPTACAEIPESRGNRQIGFTLGNLDEDLRELFGRCVHPLIPFFGFALGNGIDLNVITKSGLPGCRASRSGSGSGSGSR